jgi:hypothetical protein
MQSPKDPDTAQALAPITRRRFVHRSLLAVAGVLGASAGALAWVERSPIDGRAVPGSIVHLEPREYWLLARARDVLLPPTPGQADAAALSVLEQLDAIFGRTPAKTRADLRMALTLFDHGPMFSARLRRFVDLDHDDAVTYWDGWLSGSVTQRTIAGTLRLLVTAAFLMLEGSWVGTDYEGPVSRLAGFPMLGNAPLPGAAGETTPG